MSDHSEPSTGFESVMSPEEALMWRLGSDPRLDPSGGLLATLDQAVDVDLLRRKLSAGAVRFPRLAERVIEPTSPLAAPFWATDPHFDPAMHVIEVSVPPPGAHRDVLDLTAQLMAEPFPADRPPWVIYVIHGLAEGRSGLLSRLHHAVADGLGGLRLAEVYVDLEQATDDPGETDLASFLADRQSDASASAQTDQPDAFLGALIDALGVVRSAAAEAALIGADPARAARTGGQALDILRDIVDRLAGDPYLDSTSTMWTGRSEQRYLVTAHMPLATAKTAATRLGGTVNDLFVSALAEAAVDYHHLDGEEPRSVSMSFVRSTRTGANAGGNAFVPIRIRAPGSGAEPVARFAALRDAMASAAEPNEQGLAVLSSLAAMLPLTALSRLGREQGSRVDIVTSNLRGAPVPLFVTGAKIEAAYPIGPLAGSACNATVMSNDGRLDVGIMIDPAAIDDPDRFENHVQQVFDRYADERDG